MPGIHWSVFLLLKWAKLAGNCSPGKGLFHLVPFHPQSFYALCCLGMVKAAEIENCLHNKLWFIPISGYKHHHDPAGDPLGAGGEQHPPDRVGTKAQQWPRTDHTHCGNLAEISKIVGCSACFLERFHGKEVPGCFLWNLWPLPHFKWNGGGTTKEGQERWKEVLNVILVLGSCWDLEQAFLDSPGALLGLFWQMLHSPPCATSLGKMRVQPPSTLASPESPTVLLCRFGRVLH